MDDRAQHHVSQPARGSARSIPLTVRRAQAFIQQHARVPIKVEDLARAASLSTRGLQAAFQTSLGMTPMTYLRQVRLEGARRDLQRADPRRGDSVGEIATSWGFTHVGRFAKNYRDRFGETPGETLRAHDSAGDRRA